MFVPLATPALSGSMSERMTFVSCELANPTPRPNTIIPGSSARNETSRRDDDRDQQQPDRLEREPERTMLVMLNRRVSRPAIGAAIAMRMPCGQHPFAGAQRGEVFAVLQAARGG